MYEVSGPTQIGTTGQLNEIVGDVTFPDIGTAQGTVYFANNIGNLKALPPSSAGLFLTTQGAGADPTWSATPLPDESCFLFKSGNQVISGNIATVITGFISSPTIPQYNTGSFNPTSGIFTANANAKYLINLTISFTNTSNSGSRQINVLRNNVIFASLTQQPTGNKAITTTMVMIVEPQLNITDTISFQFQNNSIPAGKTSTILGGNDTWLAISRL